MNYLLEINAFERKMRESPLPIAAQLMWYKLMQFCNGLRWPETFQLDTARLSELMVGSSKHTVIEARRALIEAGVLGFKPGLTMNLAPAATAASTCSAFRTVPAPTHMLGKLSVMILIASAAALVRKVTSAQGSPPAQSAFARGSASAALSIFTTGTIPILLICSNTAFINNTFLSYRLIVM